MSRHADEDESLFAIILAIVYEFDRERIFENVARHRKRNAVLDAVCSGGPGLTLLYAERPVSGRLAP